MNKFKGQKSNILVIGDLMIDHYLWGDCKRISPEAPVQVVNIKKESSLLGGAGNVINNLIAFEANVIVSSVIGDDAVSEELLQLLKKRDIDTSTIIQEKNRKTTKKSRVISSNQQIIRIDNESTDNILEESQDLIFKNISKSINKIDIIILSDYGKGVLTDTLTKKIIQLANHHNKKVLVDPKGNDYSKYKGAYLLTPNKREACEATQIDIIDEKSLISAHDKLKKELNLTYSIITLSEDGISIYDKNLKTIPTVAQEVFDVTGAGDTVIASIAYALSINMDIYDSVEFANYAAAVVVAKVGSATASLFEIEEYISSLHKNYADVCIKNFEEINQIVNLKKEDNKKIVFTNGCFDILHAGHVRYLEMSKSFGDLLIVGLNSDDSVKRLKGEERPINTQEDRAYLLSALESVDYVVIFEDDTPYNLIKLIKPNILVKGGDYEGKEVVGSDIAEELKLVEFVDGKSTTNIIKKIQGKKNEKCNIK